MPPKIRDLIDRLKKAGYMDRGGKGSHRHFVHPNVTKPITISGKQGDDARIYQIKADNKTLPPATAGLDFANKLQSVA